MKVLPQASGYLTNQSVLNVSRDAPVQQEREERNYGAGTAFMGGFLKYNPIALGVQRASRSYDDVDGYSPFDDLHEISGYPADLFTSSQSPEETAQIKQDYDNQLYLQEASEEEGFFGIAGALAGGLTNPLYLFPYLRAAKIATTPATLALEGAAGETATEAVYQIGGIDKLRTDAESVFNIAAGGIFGGIVGKLTLPKGEAQAIKEKIVEELKYQDNVTLEPTDDFLKMQVIVDGERHNVDVVPADPDRPLAGNRLDGSIWIQENITNERVMSYLTGKKDDPRMAQILSDKEAVNQRFKDEYGVSRLELIRDFSDDEMQRFILAHEARHTAQRQKYGADFVEEVYKKRPVDFEFDADRSALRAMGRLPAQTSGGGSGTPTPPGGSMSEIMVPDLKEGPEVGRIKGHLSRGLSKLTAIRVMASENPVARKLGSMLGEQSVVGTNRHAVETAIKQYDSMLAPGLQEVRKQFSIYKQRVPRAERIPASEFYDEIMVALRNGDSHSVPEVEIAAKKIRREVLDPIRAKAHEVGIYPSEENIAKYAESYAPRIYNFHKISAELHQFKRLVANHLKTTKAGEGFTDEDLMEAAGEIAAKIRHQYTGQNALSSHQEFKIGALQGRTVPVPDNILKPYLINNPEYVLRAWSHNMATQTEMTRMFGTTDPSSLMKQVEESWDELIEEASKESPTKATKLEKRKKDDVQVLQALWDRILNRYALPDNDSSALVRMGRATRNLNVLTKLGGMTLSAFPDMARPLYRHGLGSYAKTIKNLTTDSAFREMKRAEAERLGVALDMVINQRMTAITELDYNPNLRHGGYVGAIEHGLEKAVIGAGGQGWDFGRVSLMSPWNSSMKLMSYVMAEDGLMRMVGKNIKNAENLAQMGIDKDMAKRIKAQFDKHGGDNSGLKASNLDKWDDIAAMEAVEGALLKEVDATIITPGIMDKPLIMSTEFGKFLFQFKSFGFAATNKQLLAGLQNQNAMFYQGVLAATTLGAMTWSLKRWIAGYDDQEMSEEELLIRGIEYSGAIGFGSELITMGSGVANAMGLYKGEGNFRWARKGLFGTLLGPGVGLYEDAFRGARAFTLEEPNAGDIEALRRIIPYNNLFYTRKLFDAVEEGLKESEGIYE